MKRIALLFLLLLTACTSAPSILDLSTCEPPCWNGITVGQTSEQELLDTLSTLSIVDQTTVVKIDLSARFNDSLFSSCIEFGLVGENHPVRIIAYIQDDKVVFLRFSGDLGLEMRVLIDRYGEPGIVTAQELESWDYDIQFVYPSQGISYGTYARKVTARTDIGILYLFDTSLYQNLLDEGLWTGEYDLDEIIFYPWKGYGDIEELYWPPTRP